MKQVLGLVLAAVIVYGAFLFFGFVGEIVSRVERFLDSCKDSPRNRNIG